MPNLDRSISMWCQTFFVHLTKKNPGLELQYLIWVYAVWECPQNAFRQVHIKFEGRGGGGGGGIVVLFFLMSVIKNSTLNKL